MTRAELQALLDNKNVAAFLRVIREGESAQDDSGYFLRYHPTRRVKVDSLVGGHPRLYETTPNGKRSSAFGAYQFTATTWDAINHKYGLPDDISRASQDEHCVALLLDCGALRRILVGDFEGAVLAASTQWASLPGSPLQDGGSKMQWERARRVWDQWLGPSAPIREAAPPIAPQPVMRVMQSTGGNMGSGLVLALGEALLKFLPAFGSGSATSNRNIQMTEELGRVLIEHAKEVVPGAANEQDAVSQIEASRELQGQFRAQAAANWSELQPFLEYDEKSRQAARQFALDATSSGPIWRQIGFGLIIGILALGIVIGGGMVMAWILSQAGTDAATKLTILDYFKAIGYLVVGWAFGSSSNSRRKDEVIAAQAGANR